MGLGEHRVGPPGLPLDLGDGPHGFPCHFLFAGFVGDPAVVVQDRGGVGGIRLQPGQFLRRLGPGVLGRQDPGPQESGDEELRGVGLGIEDFLARRQGAVGVAGAHRHLGPGEFGVGILRVLLENLVQAGRG